jgi:hypothetical protein
MADSGDAGRDGEDRELSGVRGLPKQVSLRTGHADTVEKKPGGLPEGALRRGAGVAVFCKKSENAEKYHEKITKNIFDKSKVYQIKKEKV